MAKTTLLAIAVVTGFWFISPAQSQPESASRATVFSSLRPGAQVAVKDAGQSVEISTIAGVDAGTHTIIEIGDDFIVLRDIAKVTTSRVSRPDERSVKTLTKIANFFCLPTVEHLWQAELPLASLDSNTTFVQKFRERLIEVRGRMTEDFSTARREKLRRLNRALGFDDTEVPMLIGPYANKVAAIFASAEAETFANIIDAYDELLQSRAAAAGHVHEMPSKAARA